jgi:hypothetical protein
VSALKEVSEDVLANLAVQRSAQLIIYKAALLVWKNSGNGRKTVENEHSRYLDIEERFCEMCRVQGLDHREIG